MTPHWLIAAAIIFGVPTAQAQQAGLTSLACKGTKTKLLLDATENENRKEQPISMGIIVDFNAGTIQGFVDYPVKIRAADEAKIKFFGYTEFSTSSASFHGTINRVTGEVEAMADTHDLKTGNSLTATVYRLQCRPTQRML
jgi:hypothetical protein